MANRKQPSHRPQAKHKKNGSPSQFDKRARLDRKNPKRKKTTKAKVPLVGPLLAYVISMARMLDARTGFRLMIIMAGMMLSDDRRVASAIAAGGATLGAGWTDGSPTRTESLCNYLFRGQNNNDSQKSNGLGKFIRKLR